MNYVSYMLCMNYRLREIPIDDIVLVEEKHKNADFEQIIKDQNASAVVVKRTAEDKYELVIGLLDYIIAKHNGQKTVTALVTELDRTVEYARPTHKAIKRKEGKMTLEELQKCNKTYISAKEAAEVMKMGYKKFLKMLEADKFTFTYTRMKKRWVIFRVPFLKYVNGANGGGNNDNYN